MEGGLISWGNARTETARGSIARPHLRGAAFGGAVAVVGAAILLWVPLLGAHFLSSRLWAFDHLRDTPLAIRVALTLLLALAAWPAPRARLLRSLRSVPSWIAAHSALTATVGCALFFVLALGVLRQRNFELGDSAHLIQFVTLAVHTHGFHVTYDEPMELYVHSLAYRGLHAWTGADVQDAYAILSALAGLGCVAALVAFWRRRAARTEWAAVGVALVLSTAVAQLFFGYVENYSLVTCGLLAYVWIASEVLQRRARLVAAAGALGACIALHVLAGWLLPSLAYLAWQTTREIPGRRRTVAFAQCGLALVAPVAATVAFLTAMGVPPSTMGTTHWAHAKFIFHIPKDSPGFHYTAFSAGHLRDLANEWLLVSLPGALMLAGTLIVGARRDAWRDPMTRFLALGALFTHVFAATWNSEIGAYRDWDLFSIAGVFDALLGAYLLLRFVPSPRDVVAVATPVLVLSLGLTGSWVASNAHRVVDVPSHHDLAHLQAGLLRRSVGDEHDARRDFAEVVRLDPRNARALFELGTLLWDAGDREDALPLLRRFLELEPATARAVQVRRVLDASRVRPPR